MPQIAIQTASYLIAAVLLFLTLHLHLVPALFAGLLVFVIIDKMSPWLYRLSKGRASHLAASIIVAAVAVLLVSLGAVALIGLLKNGNTSGLPELWEHLADIIDDANDILPPWVVERLPSSADRYSTGALRTGWNDVHICTPDATASARPSANRDLPSPPMLLTIETSSSGSRSSNIHFSGGRLSQSNGGSNFRSRESPVFMSDASASDSRSRADSKSPCSSMRCAFAVLDSDLRRRW